MDLLENMATFVRVVETGSFSVAARQRKVSGAAVSRQVAALEEKLGVPLIRRTTRRMTVTEAGERYLERCRRVLREVDEAQAIGKRGHSRELRINASIAFGTARVAPVVARLLEENPGLRIELRLDDRLSDLVFDDLDVAVRVGVAPPDSTDVVAHGLGSFHYVVVGAPAYLERRGTPRRIEALERHDTLEHRIDRRGRWRFENGLVQTRPVLSCNAITALEPLLLAAKGLAFLPDWFVREHLRRGRLRQVLTEQRSPPISVFAMHRRELRGASQVKLFLDALRTS